MRSTIDATGLHDSTQVAQAAVTGEIGLTETTRRIDALIAAEREACAAIADRNGGTGEASQDMTAGMIAHCIRERSNQPE
jgi:hypothetical protein